MYIDNPKRNLYDTISEIEKKKKSPIEKKLNFQLDRKCVFPKET